MTRAKTNKGSSRLRAEIIEMAKDTRAAGIMTGGSFEKITLRMLDRNKLAKVEPLSPKGIRKVREQAGLSQAVFAHCLNLTVSYVSQLERGEKRPSGAAAKLLDVIRRKGIEAIQ